MLMVFVTALALSGCTSPTPTAAPTVTPAPTATPVPGPTVLTITGKVTTPLNLSLTDLKAGTQYSASWQNTAGNSSYNGGGPGSWI